ncbi:MULTISPECIES: hypothetical protein [unclassified Kitasatospora]|nr:MULTISPECIES: hypothetical protein [unclassified Kitasatospora]
MFAHAGYDLVLAVVNRVAVQHGLAAAVTVFAAVTVVAFAIALGLAQ